MSPLVRALGIFDSKIDEASGGDASAEWRYEIWQSGIDKIMEHPIIGKGFGNLPKHLDPGSTEVTQSTDFEVILAGGEAHNGFITAAYGFGIPFMLALTAGLFVRFFYQIRMALSADKHDLELRDLHAVLASMYPAYFVGIYSAFDMSVIGLWSYVGLGFILEHLPKSSTARDSLPATAQPTEAYMYPSRY
jgi:O-antigen ligase